MTLIIMLSFNQRPVLIEQSILELVALAVHVLCNSSGFARAVIFYFLTDQI